MRLLQNWQLRYTHKQQFLGDFFELLLKSGFKQESGQFFTPVPLVRFIIECLPIKSTIEAKAISGDIDLLPNIIDFACGSGHFLTEAMEITNAYLMEVTDSGLSPTQKKKLDGYKVNQYSWASEFVYGIERDYRLAKTTKLSLFLNGDGEANIIHGSGLDPLSHLPGKLKHPHQFDVLVANPPYAVKGFKNTLIEGKESYKLFDTLPDKSQDIEILFMERACEIMKPGGLVGIILPRSFLNGDNYIEIRKMIIENFELKSIVMLGKKAFMATKINTAILFMKKRIKNLKLNTLDDLKEISKNEELLLVRADPKDSDEEANFLGYNFSTRKGNEGIQVFENSKLFDNTNPDNTNCINFYIKSLMSGLNSVTIPSSLQECAHLLNLEEIIDWNEYNKFRLVYVDSAKIQSTDPNVRLIPIFSVLDTLKSGKRPKFGVGNITEGAWSLGGEHIDSSEGELSTDKMKFVSIAFYNEMNSESYVCHEDILLNKDGAYTGKVAWFDENEYTQRQICINEHLFRIRVDPIKCQQRFMFYFMMSSFFQKQVVQLAHNNKAQPGLNRQHFKKILFPNLKLPAQDKLIKTVHRKWENLSKNESRRDLVNEEFSKIGLVYS